MKFSRSMPEAEQPSHHERDPLYGEKRRHAGETNEGPRVCVTTDRFPRHHGNRVGAGLAPPDACSATTLRIRPDAIIVILRPR